MGHLVITKDGLKSDLVKIKAVQEMPRPTSKKELLGLLGFVNFYLKVSSEAVRSCSATESNDCEGGKVHLVAAA